MKLRTQINLIVGFLSATFVALVMLGEFKSVQLSVHEELLAANTVAAKTLSRVVETYGQQSQQDFRDYLAALGRVRAHDLQLIAADGAPIYRSPPSTYKAGRQAPQWFESLMLPALPMHEFTLGDGAHLILRTDASRAILDGWDGLITLLLIGTVLLIVLNGAVFYLVGRTLAPLPEIAAGLSQLQSGNLNYRLPEYSAYEARVIGAAFNNTALTMEAKERAERAVRTAQMQLEDRQELALLIEQRLDEERRMIARELHDEFAQSVTAIRSIAFSITQSTAGNAAVAEPASLIASEAARLYDAMHSLIPRLAPLSLDSLGLAETLQTFVNDWRKRHPEIDLQLAQNLSAPLGPSVTLAIYRVVQEGLINAIRHGHPSEVKIEVQCAPTRVYIRVQDNGTGLPAEWPLPGRFGLRGLRDRIHNLGGELNIGNRATQGVELMASIPLPADARSET